MYLVEVVWSKESLQPERKEFKKEIDAIMYAINKKVEKPFNMKVYKQIEEFRSPYL